MLGTVMRIDGMRGLTRDDAPAILGALTIPNGLTFNTVSAALVHTQGAAVNLCQAQPSVAAIAVSV
jgi:hypothetical protein